MADQLFKLENTDPKIRRGEIREWDAPKTDNDSFSISFDYHENSDIKLEIQTLTQESIREINAQIGKISEKSVLKSFDTMKVSTRTDVSQWQFVSDCESKDSSPFNYNMSSIAEGNEESSQISATQNSLASEKNWENKALL